MTASVGVERPGGLALTDRALDRCAFEAGSRLLDVGCGSGATVPHLRATQLQAVGLASDPDKVRGGPGLLCARGDQIPFPSAWFRGVLLECSLSVMEDPDAVLRECRRVLVEGGRLIVSDLFAQKSLRLGGCLGRVDTREDLLALLSRNGFSAERFEEHPEHLRGYFGQMLLDSGAGAFEENVGIDLGALKAARCSYCLIVARREPA